MWQPSSAAVVECTHENELLTLESENMASWLHLPYCGGWRYWLCTGGGAEMRGCVQGGAEEADCVLGEGLR